MTLDTNRLATPVTKETGRLSVCKTASSVAQKRRTNGKATMYIVGTSRGDTPKGRTRLLETLQGGHPGVCRTKALARSFLWWPRVDTATKQMTKACPTCQETRKSPTRAPLQPWRWPQTPWRRLHIDYAMSFMGKMFFSNYR